MESINTDEATKQAIRTSIKKIAGMYNLDIVEIINCTVVSVDKPKRKCVVKPLSGKSDTNIENVGLMMEVNDGEFKIPAVDSTVGVVISTLVDPYLIGWSDLDEWYIVIGTTTVDILNGSIKFGDGSFDGLAKVADLTTKLNNLENKVNTIITNFNTHTHLGVTVGSGVTGTTASVVVGTLTPTQQAEIENPDITHGTT